MIRLESIFNINKRNRYKYIFDENNGSAYLYSSLNGDGIGNGFLFGYLDRNRQCFLRGFGYSNGDGDSEPTEILTKDYKND